MATTLYNSYKDDVQKAAINLLTDTIKVALIDTGVYSFNQAHDRYDDISGVVGTPVALANKSLSAGVYDADDVTFTGVTGASIEAYILFKDTGTPSTSPLIGFFDNASSGLPVTPNGGNITITWDNGTNKIFKL